MEIHSNHRLVDLKDLLDHVFSTEAGEKLFKMLREEYCDSSCLKDKPELTYYCLGQKELIETLFHIAEDEEFKSRIQVKG